MKKFLHKAICVATCCLISTAGLAQKIITKTSTQMRFSGLAVGDEAPALKIAKLYQSPKGQPMTPQDLRGKVVVLEFWSTWCAPCIAQMPHVNDLAQKMKKFPIRFISISEEKPAAVEHFLKQGILKTCVAVMPERGIFRDYKIIGMPCTVIIGKDGRVACITLPGKLNEALLTGLLTNASTDPASAELQVVSTQSSQAPSHVTISPSTSKNAMGGGSYQMGVFELNGYPAPDMVAFAMSHGSLARLILETKLPDGRFDLDAKMARGEAAKLPGAMRNALSQAFKVDLIAEKRKMPALVMTLPAGPKGSLAISKGESFHISSSDGVLAARSTPMSTLLEHVEAELGKIIVDDTKVKDKVNFVLTYTSGNEQSLLNALRSLGFKIERKERVVDVVVVKRKG